MFETSWLVNRPVAIKTFSGLKVSFYQYNICQENCNLLKHIVCIKDQRKQRFEPWNELNGLLVKSRHPIYIGSVIFNSFPCSNSLILIYMVQSLYVATLSHSLLYLTTNIIASLMQCTRYKYEIKRSNNKIWKRRQLPATIFGNLHLRPYVPRQKCVIKFWKMLSRGS
jgi:hypothetical protein